MGIQSLGNNTFTITDGQLIVQGPDLNAATAIAKKLALGEAKLGDVQGKQVLVFVAWPREGSTPQPETPKQQPATPQTVQQAVMFIVFSFYYLDH